MHPHSLQKSDKTGMHMISGRIVNPSFNSRTIYDPAAPSL